MTTQTTTNEVSLFIIFRGKTVRFADRSRFTAQYNKLILIGLEVSETLLDGNYVATFSDFTSADIREAANIAECQYHDFMVKVSDLVCYSSYFTYATLVPVANKPYYKLTVYSASLIGLEDKYNGSIENKAFDVEPQIYFFSTQTIINVLEKGYSFPNKW